MFARPSFFADIVQPSASENISCAIAFGVRSACPASRCLMNQEFSANRQASRKKGFAYLSQRARTPRRFSRETGWPPPELFVTVTITSGTRSPSSASVFSRRARSTFPLNGWIRDGTFPSAMTRSRASAFSTSMFARVVSKWVLLGTTWPGFRTVWNRMRSAARPWWVGMTCLNPVRSWMTSRKRKKERLPA